ncbi:Cation transport protein ChaC [hydrothermal vent metagenome]|uniref:glutathione-specific gamma-glutamylcyclotransferase n=1 Tax=hydrothermal vent metagenome TaxID=652676 RepID=A0A3B0U7Y0_9ZZZZ
MVHSYSFWVFGYGSLIWRPGFEFISAQGGLLCGFHRSLCIYSHLYRGTPEKPGLVFGLLPGGSCRGRAFEISSDKWAGVLSYLRERETQVYREVRGPIKLDDGRKVEALSFVANEDHAQFAGGLSIEEKLALVDSSQGQTGSNRDYIFNTMEHLTQLGISDRRLDNICRLLEQKQVS